MSLADSQKFCADRVRRLDPDRYISSLFAPDRCRPAILALYAFNLEIATISDTVSEPLIGRMRLQWWRDTLSKMIEGEEVGHGLCDSLAEALRIENLPVHLLHKMIDGREFELSDRPPADRKEIENYLDATVVGLLTLTCAVLCETPPPEDDLVRHAGLAIGLTGLIRMIPHNARHGRVFLPSDLMQRVGVDSAPIIAGRVDRGHAEIIQQFAGRAWENLEHVRKARPRRPRAIAFLPICLAAHYLTRLARANYDPFVPGLEPGRFSRQIRLTCAAWRAR